MVEKDRIELPKLQGHLCFACGTANPKGLDLHFYRSGDTICTDITLDKYYMGWENMAHGGIISTLLDEVMSWTIIYFKKVFFVTRRMEIKYIQPVPIDIPLTAKGRLMEDMRKPFIGVKAEVCNNEGLILAKSTGRFAEIPEEELSQVPKDMKNQMSLLFNRFPSS